MFVGIATNEVFPNDFIYDSNGGFNYQATFTVEAPLNVSIHQFSAVEKLSQVHLNAAIEFEKPLINVSFQKMSEDGSRSAWNEIASFEATLISRNLQHVESNPEPGDHYTGCR
ncbi:MAG: hypothetical protein IPI60_08895 [Saprospiraceae bacterium]|nr:hypothetical protein [Saprospiraceae bacterium]